MQWKQHSPKRKTNNTSPEGTWFKSTVPIFLSSQRHLRGRCHNTPCPSKSYCLYVRVLPFGRAFGKHVVWGIQHFEACHSDKSHSDKSHSDKSHSDKSHSDKSHSDKSFSILLATQVFHFGSFPLAIRWSSLPRTFSSVQVVFKEKSKEGNRVADSMAKHKPRNV